ncbi:MAG: hypothetical protein C0459_01545 [Chitinophaga sp.]|jgi:hypothetical protein|nr:hypothetical protein [Chitinophaga sp.]
MKKIVFLLGFVFVFVFTVKAQTFDYVNQYVYANTDNKYDIYTTWQNDYYGTDFEIHCWFTSNGTFSYDIVVYPNVFGAETGGAYNEFFIDLYDEDANVDYSDSKSEPGVNTYSETLAGTFNVGTPSTSHSFLFNIGFLSANGKYGGYNGQVIVHW